MMREPVRPIIIMFLFAAGGIITWLATDGIIFVWKEFCHPPFSMPIALIFAHWIIIYILFALLSFRYSALSCCGEACLRCTVGYLATLFWCPLMFLSCGCLITLLSLVLSVFHILWAFATCNRRSAVTVLISIFLIASEIYYMYLTVGFFAAN